MSTAELSYQQRKAAKCGHVSICVNCNAAHHRPIAYFHYRFHWI